MSTGSPRMRMRSHPQRYSSSQTSVSCTPLSPPTPPTPLSVSPHSFLQDIHRILVTKMPGLSSPTPTQHLSALPESTENVIRKGELRRRAKKICGSIKKTGRLVLEVAKESSDAFPPLKGFCGGLVKILEINDVCMHKSESLSPLYLLVAPLVL